MSQPDLISLIPEDAARVALVGLAKNSGKTTTLNALLDAVQRDSRSVGMVSIGIDGESHDMLIGTRKPTIHAQRGDWVVTAQDAIARSGARVEYVESLGFSTPLGEVVVGRVLGAGHVILAGLRHQRDLSRALEVLSRHEVDLAFIDGAYGRVVAARPSLSDGVIVSTGAVLGRSVDAIVEKTADVVDRLRLEPARQPWQIDLLERAESYGGALLGGPDIEPRKLPSRSALLGLSRAEHLWSDEVTAIAVAGLVSDSVIESLLAVDGENRTLLVPDGTVIQGSPVMQARLERSWTILVGAEIRVLAISINPTSVQGHEVDESRLRSTLNQRWPNLPVVNPLNATCASA